MTAGETRTADYGERVAWGPPPPRLSPGRGLLVWALSPAAPPRPPLGVARPRIHPVRLLVAWLLSAAALLVAAWIVPGASTSHFGGALVAALVIALLNAVLPPLVAALRLPLMLLTGFLLILVVDALMLLA